MFFTFQGLLDGGYFASASMCWKWQGLSFITSKMQVTTIVDRGTSIIVQFGNDFCNFVTMPTNEFSEKRSTYLYTS